MNKQILILTFLMLWASSVVAEEALPGNTAAVSGEEIVADFRINGGYYKVNNVGSTQAAEYEYLDSSAAGALNAEWDPLPHRFVLESYYLNEKDYFGEVDYSYRDVVVFNGYTRSLFHNLDHFRFPTDDVSTAFPAFRDLDPTDLYGIENRLNKAFVRLKTPDFPLHLYSEIRTIEREGSLQQRFLSGDHTTTSQSREIDWNSREYRVGVNSHLSWIEADYSHTEKKFDASGDRVLTETSLGIPVTHNLVPDLESSWDTVKVHTSYSGKLVLSGTYSSGDKSNEDSGAKATFKNTAGDLMFMPVTSVIFSMRYRHFDNDVTNPDLTNMLTLSGDETLHVRDSISSKRDLVSGVLRYRVTDYLTVRGEYTGDTTDRTRGLADSTLAAPPAGAPAFWVLPTSTTKATSRMGLSYRVKNRMTFRADYSQQKVDNPAYDTDPDKANNARAWLTWVPSSRFSTLVSYGIVRETRDNLNAPLAGGSRDARRSQALASVTVLIGSRSSLTASYANYRNTVEQTVSLQDETGELSLEPKVPYNDKSQVGSLALTVAPAERVNLTLSSTKSYSKGQFRLSGTEAVSNVGGIAELTDMKVIDTTYGAGIDVEFSRYLDGDIQYQYRHYDDEINDTQDGTVKIILATLSLKW